MGRRKNTATDLLNSGSKSKPRSARASGKSVSDRKVLANRNNSLKSTGPKTVIGRQNSSRNATKHGIFARDLTQNFIFERETIEEFQELHSGLKKDLRPIGTTEELEVEYIAVSWWRRMRLWRYENAQIRAEVARLEVDMAKDPESEKMSSSSQAIISVLNSAEREIESGDSEIDRSPIMWLDLKNQIFKTHPGIEEDWKKFEELATQSVDSFGTRFLKETLSSYEANPDQTDKILNQALSERGKNRLKILCTIWLMRGSLIQSARTYRSLLLSTLRNGRGMAQPEALERILRYGAMIERELGRAYGRLENLQRRRQGEKTLPPVTVNLE